MKHQFSLVYLTTANMSPPEMIYLASRTGYNYVSLRTIPMKLPNEPDFSLSSNRILLNLTRKALEDTGIQIHDTENARIFYGADIAAYEPEIAVAASLGARYILSNIWTDDPEFIIDSLSELSELTASYGLSVIVEFVTWSSVKTLSQAHEIILQTGKKNIGLIIDTLHFNRSHCLPEQIDMIAPKYFRFAHLCDAPATIPETLDQLIHAGRSERLYPGEGGINIASIVKKLPPMVYGLEIPHQKRIDQIGMIEHVSRALEYTKKYFEAHTL